MALDKPAYTGRPGEAIIVSRNEDGIFEIGSGRIRVVPNEPAFIGKVIDDLGRLVHLPQGFDVLRQGDIAGIRVAITQPEASTDPPNAWMLPSETECTIVYDPADWPMRGDPESPSSHEVLLILLRQANAGIAGPGLRR